MNTALLEQFALADDRAAVVARLIPGTEEHRFLACLLHQQRGELDEARALLQGWPFDRQRWLHLHTRQQILEAGTPLDERWQGLIAGERFDHRCQLPGKAPPLPSRVDPAEVDDEAAVRRDRSRGHAGVEALTQLGLDHLLDHDIDDAGLRRKALERVFTPGHPRLVDHLAADLSNQREHTFGSLYLHRQLTLDQLEALRQRLPALLGVGAFVDQMLARTGADEPDEEARVRQQLRFAMALPESFAGHKTRLVYRLIELRHRRGVADGDLLLVYLRLTRDPQRPLRTRLAAAGASEELLARVLSAVLLDEKPAAPGAATAGGAGFRGFLRGLLGGASEEANAAAFRGEVAEGLLLRLEAEARLLAGAEGAERWAARLDPHALRALEQRVDLEFAPDNPASFAVDEPVRLRLDVKNIEALVVRVFEVDAVGYFRDHQAEINVDLNLDGFVPNHEQVLATAAAPMLRRRVELPLASLDRPGTYIVDVVGGGRSCRALIRKGSLRAVARVGAAGHVLTVLDERGRPVRGATVWLGGRAFAAEEDGSVVLPFTSQQGPRQVLLSHAGAATRQTLDLVSETYRLEAAFHVEQEDLIAGAEARLWLRVRLSLADGEVSLALLERPRLLVRGQRDDVTSERSYDDLTFDDDGEAVVQFTVPEGVESLEFSLRAEVQRISGGRQELSHGVTLQLNGLRKTLRLGALHLADEPSGWTLAALGRSGEPLAGLRVRVQIPSRASSQPFDLQLSTDERGKIHLGPLPCADWLWAQADGEGRRWPLSRFHFKGLPASLHLGDGEPLRLPLPPHEAQSPRRLATLLRREGGVPLRDLSSLLRVDNGFLTTSEPLPPGSYYLFQLTSGLALAVEVARGERVEGWIVGPRLLSPTPFRPLQLHPLGSDGKHLRLRLDGASPRARVFVFASTLAHPCPTLALGSFAVRILVPSALENIYTDARTLGDEARYILSRRHAPRRPGNLLPRPGLLLNPWAVSDTTTQAETLTADEAFGAREQASGGYFQSALAGGGGQQGSDAAPDLDFLPRPALWLGPLTPAPGGLIEVPLSALEGRGVVRAVAIDGSCQVDCQVALAPLSFEPRDLRLRAALDPETPFAQQGEATALGPGGQLALGNGTYRAYDALEKVWTLLDALDRDGRCTRLDFLKRWPTLDDDQKQKHYSDHACHELHFFLYRKDRPFFDRVIAPYLASKRHLTFLDRYLLGHDLSGYLAPSALASLNALERILLAERTSSLDEELRYQEGLLASLPPDLATHERLFRAALQADALDDAPVDTATINAPLGGLGAPGLPAPPRFGAPPARPAAAQPPPPDEAEPGADAPFAEITDADIDNLFNDDVPEAKAEAPKMEKSEISLKQDLGRRSRSKPLYRALDATREFAEQHYHGRRLSEMGPALAPINPFWRDLAAHRGPGPFLSPHFAYCADGPAAPLLALAALDLPYQAAPPALARDADGGLSLTAPGPAVVFHEQVRPVQPEGGAPLLLAQHYLQPSPESHQPPSPAGDELLAGQRYHCQVIASNPSPVARQIDLLLQIPEGSIGLGGVRPTRSERLRLGPFETRTLDYSFYFPLPGSFVHYPAQASERGHAAGRAQRRALRVVLTPSSVDHGAWPHLSQAGSDDEVIEALQTRNLHPLALSLIAFRLHDRAFYDRALAVLERRRAYAPVLWAYALLHRDPPRAADYLRRRGLDALGPLGVEAPWLRVDPLDTALYEHFDYAPLVNPRAHGPAAGGERILNQRIAAQVQRLLLRLCARASVDDDDRLAWVYYLLLQDRTDEALAHFARVDEQRARGKIQLDYVRAYLAFSAGEPAAARAIAEPYAGYPVDRWRDRFREVLAQLDEIEGKVALPADPTDRDQHQAHLAATAPALELRPEGDRLRLHHRHAPRCEVRFYQMDIELLFSQRPFGLQAFDERPPLRPNHTAALDTGLDEGTSLLPIPEPLRGRPLLVEVACGEARATLAHTASNLAVQITEAYGQLRVSHAPTSAPLPGVYVKVYARDAGGHERFHKDGYTDLRGRFDYASVSGDAPPPQRFALLLLSDDHGAALREVNAPTR